MTVTVVPATPDRWDDVARLAGPRGFDVDCWCMWWLSTNAEIDQRGDGDAHAGLQSLVADGRQPGLLAYRDGEPVWSLPCFYVPTAHRGTGVVEALLAATTEHAAAHGAEILEGYPVDSATGARTAVRVGSGALRLFEQTGFVEVARRDGRSTVSKHLAPVTTAP